MLEAAERSNRAPNTIEFLLCKSKHVLRLIGASAKCSDITLDDTVRYVDKRLAEGVSRHTAHKEIRTLIQALRRAQKHGKLAGGDPRLLMPDELRGAYVPRERWLTHDDVDLLLAELQPERRDYVATLAWTGLRSGELFSLTGADYLRATNEIQVRGTKTAKSRRRIPLQGLAAEIVQRRADAVGPAGLMFPVWHTIGRDLDAATLRIEKRLNPGWARPPGNPRGRPEIAGVGPKRDVTGRPPSKRGREHPPVRFASCSPNDLRRTFASWLAASGVPIQHAMDLMGHASLTMLTLVYARLAPTTLHAAMATMAGHRTVTDAVTTTARKPAPPSTPRAGVPSKKPAKPPKN